MKFNVKRKHELYTTSELARLAGVSISPVQRLIETGAIVPIYSRKRLALFDEDAALRTVEALATSNQKGTIRS